MTDALRRFESTVAPASVVRLLVVVVGGLLVLQSTQGLSPLKVAYLAIAAIAFVLSCRAVLGLRARPMFEAARPWLIASLLVFALIAISLPVALLHGTPVSDWLRDAATYGLFASAPIFALDAAASMRSTLLLRLVVVIAALGALSFAIYWVTARNLAILPFDQLVLPTSSLPTTLFLVSASAAVIDRRNRIGWMALGGIALGLFLVAGTRSAFFLLVGLPIIVIVAGKPMWPRALGASLGVGLFAFAFVVAVQATFVVAGRDVAPPIDVAVATPGSSGATSPGGGSAGGSAQPGATAGGSAGAPIEPTPRPAANPDENVIERLQHFLAAPERDGSVRERVAQYVVAWDLFVSSPIVGVGLGHQFPWTRIDGTRHSDLTADTPLTLPAKLGLLGLAWLVVLAVVWIRFVVRLRRTAGATIPGLALAGWAAVLVALAWAVFTFEDKGFSFSLMFLLALGFIEIERAATQDPAVARPSEGD